MEHAMAIRTNEPNFLWPRDPLSLKLEMAHRWSATDPNGVRRLPGRGHFAVRIHYPVKPGSG